MSWKHLNIRKANAEIERLRAALAKVGRPQEGKPVAPGALRTLRIGGANLEIERLQSLLDAATPPVINEEHISGRSASFQKANDVAPPVASRVDLPGVSIRGISAPAAAGAKSLSRFQVLSALECFPAVDVVGTESDEVLQVMLKNASHEAGIRLPGETDVTPGELRQQKLNQILGAAEPEVTAGEWNLAALTSLTDAIFGRGTAQAETRTVHYYNPESPAAILAAKMNAVSKGSYEWRQLEKEMRAAERAELSAQHAPPEQQRKIDTLRNFLCQSGIRVPGLSFAGLPISEAAKPLHPKDLIEAQTRCDKFCAVLAGDVEASRGSHPAAAAARKFIAAQNRRPFVLGMVPGAERTHQQLDAEKYPRSNIPRY